MLSESRNRLLTQTSAGTPMGDLLRRYWMPIAGASQLAENPVKPVRLMGEDLVLFRDFRGVYGLVDRHCPHRRADLSYGFVEECGLRCNYHGWLYDETGACIAQPYEDTANPKANLKAEIRIKAYPVKEIAGLLFAYLGPRPVPECPNWEFFNWKNGFRQIVISEIPCNWLQCQENSIDPVHFEWMHANWSVRLKGRHGPYSPTHKQVAFDEFEYGFQYRRIRADTNENDPLWKVGRVCLWPNMLYTGNHVEYRVPVDDGNTLSVAWFFSRVPIESQPYVQNDIPTWESPIKDEKTGRWIDSHIMNQDFIAWVGQGTVADRTKENLGASDRGVALIRKRFMDDLKTIEEGGDPKAVIRDAGMNRAGVKLPVAYRKTLEEGLPRAEILSGNDTASVRRFAWCVGQPESVRAAYSAAMGFEAEN